MTKRQQLKAQKQQVEIAALHERERAIDLNNQVADAVVYGIQLEPEINNAALMRAYRVAIERFKSEMLPEQIRAIVDAVVVLEVMARRRGEALRRMRPERRRRA